MDGIGSTSRPARTDVKILYGPARSGAFSMLRRLAGRADECGGGTRRPYRRWWRSVGHVRSPRSARKGLDPASLAGARQATMLDKIKPYLAPWWPGRRPAMASEQPV